PFLTHLCSLLPALRFTIKSIPCTPCSLLLTPVLRFNDQVHSLHIAPFRSPLSSVLRSSPFLAHLCSLAHSCPQVYDQVHSLHTLLPFAHSCPHFTIKSIPCTPSALFCSLLPSVLRSSPFLAHLCSPFAHPCSQIIPVTPFLAHLCSLLLTPVLSFTIKSIPCTPLLPFAHLCSQFYGQVHSLHIFAHSC
ncbi:predicted protein, partial [Nematostella vectensis]